MALFRSRRETDRDCQPELAAVAHEVARSDLQRLKILAFVAVLIVGALWLYTKTNNRPVLTDVRPSAIPRVEQMTTGSGKLERADGEKATPAPPSSRTLDTDPPPEQPNPTEQ